MRECSRIREEEETSGCEREVVSLMLGHFLADLLALPLYSLKHPYTQIFYKAECALVLLFFYSS